MNSFSEKPTEIELRPDTWRQNPISDICKKITDGTHNPPKRVGDGIPLLSCQNIKDGYIDFSVEPSYIDEEDFKKMDRSFSIRKNDILSTVVGTLGRATRIGSEDNKRFTIQRSVALLRPSDSVNPEYLLQFMRSPLFKNQMQIRSKATAQAGLYLRQLRKIPVAVPPLSEQEKIASVLYNVDRAIQKTEEIIEQTKRVKKGLMQDLFTEGFFEHEKYDDHPTLGRHPFNWNIEEISKVSDIEMGSSPKSEFYNKEGEGMPFFQGNNEFGFKYPEVEVWCSNPQKKAKKGDILLSVRAPVGDLNIANQACCIGRGLAAIKAKKVDRDYLSFHLNERKKFLKRIATGSTYDSINSKDLKNLEIKIPLKEEQEKISETLVNLDRQLLKEKENKKKLKLLKKGLMQDLLTGEVRTKDKPIEVLPEVKSHG